MSATFHTASTQLQFEYATAPLLPLIFLFSVRKVYKTKHHVKSKKYVVNEKKIIRTIVT